MSPPAAAGAGWSEPSGAEASDLPVTAPPTSAARAAAARARSSGWALPLLIVPLISYSIAATIAVAILYSRLQNFHPLQELPDIGENPGVQKMSPESSIYRRVAPETALPDSLKVRLGDSLRLGDLEVTPRSVSLRRIKYKTGNYEPEDSARETLVMDLSLKNLSTEYAFHPTDPYFERRWQPKKGSSKPYMFLEFDRHQVFGGALEWRPPSANRSGRFAEPRERIMGQKHDTLLKPGQSMETMVCLDPETGIANELATYKGTLTWRVQLRRGVVSLPTKRVAASAVIGVVFDSGQIGGGEQASLLSRGSVN